jgi:hypothetical protein
VCVLPNGYYTLAHGKRSRLFRRIDEASEAIEINYKERKKKKNGISKQTICCHVSLSDVGLSEDYPKY